MTANWTTSLTAITERRSHRSATSPAIGDSSAPGTNRLSTAAATQPAEPVCSKT